MIETKTIGQLRSDSPTLVFLHEGLGSISTWRDFPAQLCERCSIAGFLYSRNGYGQSAAFTEPLDDDFMHREAEQALPALLRENGINHPILIGHSDGASIALIYAAQCTAIDAPTPLALVAMAPHILVESICLESITQLRDRFASDIRLRAGLARNHRDPVKTFETWSDAWLSPKFKQWNIESLLPSICCDVLAIQGIDDQFGTLRQVTGIADLHKNTTVVDLPNCGHSPHAECADAVLDCIANFVAPHNY